MRIMAILGLLIALGGAGTLAWNEYALARQLGAVAATTIRIVARPSNERCVAILGERNGRALCAAMAIRTRRGARAGPVSPVGA